MAIMTDRRPSGGCPWKPWAMQAEHQGSRGDTEESSKTRAEWWCWPIWIQSDCAPCIRERKDIIGSDGIDLVVIARQAIESWLLADTDAMRRWLNDPTFYEAKPEMPSKTLRGIGLKESKSRTRGQRGPGRKQARYSLRKMIGSYEFDVTFGQLNIRAVQVPAILSTGCASWLRELSTTGAGSGSGGSGFPGSTPLISQHTSRSAPTTPNPEPLNADFGATISPTGM